MEKGTRSTNSVKYHVVIIELDSTLPRRDPRKPHLYICLSLSTAEDRLRRLKMNTDRKYAQGHFLSVFAKDPYSKPTKDLKIAKRRLKETVEKYSRQGHAVNNKTDEWRVYVIDLCQDHLTTKSKLGHVYVGSTSKTVAERVKEHEFGAESSKGHRLNSKYVKDNFCGLNNSLSLKKKFYTRISAEEREESYSEELCRKGYLVRAGQFTPNQKTCKSKRK